MLFGTSRSSKFNMSLVIFDSTVPKLLSVGFRYQLVFLKVVIITNLGQRQISALNAENITDLPETLQVPPL